MGLPNVFFKKQTHKNELFISVLLTEKSVSSALWRVVNQEISILNQSRLRFFQTQEEQLIQCDESLQDLGKESEQTDQVLFALEPEWASQTQIKAEHDERLQELCKDLSLQAVGFALTTEALISHLLSDNPYLSSLVLYIGATTLTLTVTHQGKIQQTLSVGRSEDIFSDVKEVLARLRGESEANGQKLPLNIVLAAASVEKRQLSEYRQQLLAIDWTQEFGLVQTPLVDLVFPEELLDMVVKHAGVAIAQDQGLMPTQNKSQDFAQGAEFQKQTSANNLEKNNQTAESLANSQQESQDGLPTSFGVPIDPQKGSSSESFAGKSSASSSTATIQTNDVGEKNNQPKGVMGLFGKKRKPKSSVGQNRENLSDTSRKSNKNKSKKSKIILIVIVAVLFGLVVSMGLTYFLLRNNYQAVIQVFPNTQVIDKEVNIVLDPQISVSDPQQNLLKADVVYEEVQDTASVKTTGVTLVGEKAEGKVLILNKTDADKTFAQGTVLKTNDLEFELVNEEKVPASTTEVSSSGDSEEKKYGQKEVNVIAKEIGTEGNIDKDTSFQIESFSDNTYSAKAVDNFEGGSSREIRVVAEADLQELLVSLRQKLLKQAREQLEQKKSSQQPVIPTDQHEIVNQKYSAEIGDEEDSVSLTLSLKLQGLAYTNSDLVELAKAVLNEETPEGYRFMDDQPDLLTQSSQPDGDSNQITIEAKISGIVQGVIEEDELKQQLLGMKEDEVYSFLNKNELILI